MNGIINDPTKRHDFLLLFDVTDGNPNGDPDASNLPRVDPETMQGLVTDVCLKRKVRNFIDVAAGGGERTKIYVQDKGLALNTQHERAYSALGIKSTGAKQRREDVERARAWMCQNFIDIRLFGAVMTTGVNCGQVRGPIQLTFARSVDPITPLDLSITRVAVTRAEDSVTISGSEGEERASGKLTEMGRKPLVPYGLYLGYGFFSPKMAESAGADESDMALFWRALQQMWDLDRSSSRGMMACRGLYVFTHDDPLGNAPAQTLFSRFEARLKTGVETPRRFEDYQIVLNGHDLPQGITLTRLVE